MENSIKKLKIRNKIKTIFILVIALTITAVCYNLFLLQLNIVTGGANGIATITKRVFNIDQSIMIFTINILFLITSRIFLGKEKTMGILAISIIYPIFVKLTEPLTNIVQINTGDVFILVIFAGLLCGFANGLIYRSGYNSGGLSVLCQVLYEKLKVPLDKAVLFVNLAVVLAGAIVFGIEKAMFAIIYLYISNIIMNKVLLGISTNKAFYIITSEPEEISDYIINVLGHDTTNFEVKGGFLEKSKKVILTIVPTRDYYRIKEGIKMIDDKAFFIATDSYEVKGAN